jgi:FMNH2-dependent dimethyl sulfone monooxygenase
MKVGIYLPVFGGWLKGAIKEEPLDSFDYIRKSAILAEELGFDSIWIADHLLNPIKGADSVCHEAWTTLSALAAITNRVMLSHATLCQGFRNPSLLAKMGSTLQEISEGRFILTLGAGWHKQEFESYGFEWHEHDARIARAREQIDIIKSLWTEPVTNYGGAFYSIKEGILEPKPVPVPEIWFGGESDASKRVVVDLADGWLIYPTPIDEIETKINSLDSLLDGRVIKYIASSHVILGKSIDDAKYNLRELAGHNSELINRIEKTGLVGSPDTIKEKMELIKQAGVDVLLLRFSRTIDDLRTLAASIF